MNDEKGRPMTYWGGSPAAPRSPEDRETMKRDFEREVYKREESESETPETAALMEKIIKRRELENRTAASFLRHNDPQPSDVMDIPQSLIELARSLERRLFLAQTEIKGHMRIEDELKARIVELEKELRGQREVLALMPDTIRGSTWQTDKLRQSAATLVTIISNELTNSLKARA